MMMTMTDTHVCGMCPLSFDFCRCSTNDQPVLPAEYVRPLAYQIERATQLPETWVLVLNRYQRDNLLWLLNAIGYPWEAGPVEPFNLANTGDWVGELALMLMKREDLKKSMTIDANDRPNMSLVELAERVSRWVAQRHSDGSAVPRCRVCETDGREFCTLHNDGCSCEPKGQALHERSCTQSDGCQTQENG